MTKQKLSLGNLPYVFYMSLGLFPFSFLIFLPISFVARLGFFGVIIGHSVITIFIFIGALLGYYGEKYKYTKRIVDIVYVIILFFVTLIFSYHAVTCNTDYCELSTGLISISLMISVNILRTSILNHFKRLGPLVSFKKIGGVLLVCVAQYIAFILIVLTMEGLVLFFNYHF